MYVDWDALTAFATMSRTEKEASLTDAPVFAPTRHDYPLRTVTARRWSRVARRVRAGPNIEVNIILRSITQILGKFNDPALCDKVAKASRAQVEAGDLVPCMIVGDFEQGFAGEVVFVSPAEREKWMDWGICRMATLAEVQEANRREEWPRESARARRRLHKSKRRLTVALRMTGHAHRAAERLPAWIEGPEPVRQPETGVYPRPDGGSEVRGLPGVADDEVTDAPPEGSIELPFYYWTQFSSVHEIGREFPPNFPCRSPGAMLATYFGDAMIDPTRSPMLPDPVMFHVPGKPYLRLLVGPTEQGTLYVLLDIRASWPIDLRPETAHLHPGLIDGQLAKQMWGRTWQN